MYSSHSRSGTRSGSWSESRTRWSVCPSQKFQAIIVQLYWLGRRERYMAKARNGFGRVLTLECCSGQLGSDQSIHSYTVDQLTVGKWREDTHISCQLQIAVNVRNSHDKSSIYSILQKKHIGFHNLLFHNLLQLKIMFNIFSYFAFRLLSFFSLSFFHRAVVLVTSPICQ